MHPIRRLDPAAPLPVLLTYRFFYWICMAIATLIYRARFYGTENVPATGGVLVIANHESHFDPPLVGVGVRARNTAPIAREGLFRVPLLGPLLHAIGCIPINEGEGKGDAAAIRAAIAALKAGRVIVMFPEGSRSPDGRMHAFKRGAWLLISRSGVPVVPAAVSGCFQAWPRQHAFPNLFNQRVAVSFGEPLLFEDLKRLGADGAMATLAERVAALRAGLKAKGVGE